MFDDLVRFDINYKMSKLTVKMTVPKDAREFIENLKFHFEEFMYYPYDELIVLYPTTKGRMEEIQSNDDIEFIKKTKFCIDLTTGEIFCSVEFVIVVKNIKQQDNPVNQMKVLCQKIDELSCQTFNLAFQINKKMEERSYSIQKTFRSILSELRPCVKPKNNLKTEKFLCTSSKLCNGKPKILEPYFESSQRNINAKLASTNLPSITINNNSLEPEQSKKYMNMTYSKQHMNDLLGLLLKQGFENHLRNIIVLIRFDYNYEKAFHYLKSKPIS